MKDIFEMYRIQLKECYEEEMKLIEAMEENSKTPKGIFMRIKLAFTIANRVNALYRIKNIYINTRTELTKANIIQQQ